MFKILNICGNRFKLELLIFICINTIIDYNFFFFAEELIEDKELKEITFLSKDLIKLSNFCEKKSMNGLK